MSKKILFVSHEASRTGAPIVLLHFLRWFQANSSIPFQIILNRGGVLEPDFQAISPTFVWQEAAPASLSLSQRVFRKLKSLKGQEEAKRPSERVLQYLKQFSKDEIGLIYVNTIDNASILLTLQEYLDVPTILHVHELAYIMKLTDRDGLLRPMLSRVKHFIAVSQAVKDNLEKNQQIPEKQISVVYEFIAPSSTSSGLVPMTRSDLGIPENAFVVMASGNPQWRKGMDLFLQVAMLVPRLSSQEVYFIWLGGSEDNLWFYQSQMDIEKAGISHYVKLITSQDNPEDYFKLADVFLMTSREDPYPLVNLEVGLLSKPIICFDKSGGTPELLSSEVGLIVPYLDTYQMAEKIVYLHANPSIREELGKRLFQKVQDNHMVEVTAPQILAIIQEHLPNPS